MDSIFYGISNIPNVVWSAVIASLLTFLGVLWTNKGNERRQAALLAHEEIRLKAEQKLSLKKDVFLALAGSFANVLGIIPNLMNLNVTGKDINEQIGDHSAIVARTYLSARESTVAEILKYSSAVAETYLSLLRPRDALLDHKRAIEIYQETIDQANEEKDRIISIMKEFNLQGRQEEAMFNYLNESYENQEKIIEESYASQNEQQGILKGLHREYCQRCISEHGRLLLLLPPVTIALRKELENDDDSQVFINAINESVQRMKLSFEQLLN
ncbi:hypothetical protein SAMN06297229_1193 [Pseudidiomarina planktonica]|uniref:Uncharacterized protein n=1 Tax=Pseudidiomarina planktonica TaxID=1323738 RepID=A0A1Y6ERG5_9GAMM|nr:chromosome partitioning protein ParA [Pseudidiomarina planktonica]RUO65404.1 chromosome partitioning protein ParA [Pseudidiomarina planktonica]SMQ65147.1 hypothetical protein SAMN06297229_1193 [Pseudidiomarina planktonica]